MHFLHFTRKWLACAHHRNNCTDFFLPSDLVCSLSILCQFFGGLLSIKAVKEKS